ncbi:hypothetical protein D6783_02140 [Candidatus Woesearchaeota archaeon]|nr:MAG: hypothetical protein D6783_02140 [Candidatus Woesearchaeota archaeon]
MSVLVLLLLSFLTASGFFLGRVLFVWAGEEVASGLFFFQIGFLLSLGVSVLFFVLKLGGLASLLEVLSAFFVSLLCRGSVVALQISRQKKSRTFFLEAVAWWLLISVVVFLS